jgi:hypothetical protein
LWNSIYFAFKVGDLFFETKEGLFLGYELLEFGASLFWAESLEASLGGHLHPGVDRVPTYFVFSGNLSNLTAGPGLLDDVEFYLWGGMNVGHGNTMKS